MSIFERPIKTDFTVFPTFNLKLFQCNKGSAWQSTISLSAGKVECLYVGQGQTSMASKLMYCRFVYAYMVQG